MSADGTPEVMVEVALPLEAAPLPPNVHPWIKWIHEPRHISAVLAALHLFIAAAGLFVVFAPDTHYLNHLFGSVSADFWGAFLVLGGIFGATGALPGWFYLERAGLATECLGIGQWTAGLWISRFDHPAVMSFFSCIGLALIMSLLNRYLRIMGSGLDPRRLRS